jgi:hypothetical protein
MTLAGLLEGVPEVAAELVGSDLEDIGRYRSSGASRARTGDLLHAMQALSQLSYSPGKFKIYRKIEVCPLSILGRLDPQIDAAAACHQLAREKVATAKLPAVGRYEIYLVLGIRAALVARRSAPRAHEIDAYHRSFILQRTPLALHAVDVASDIETEVITRVFHDRAQNRDSQMGRRCSDLCFRDGSLSVRR